jgi:hypothetical protein
VAELAVEAPAHHQSCYQHRVYYLRCADWDALWELAGGCCQMCGTPAAETTRGKLCIDHDPDYGQMAVRGLLCDACNAFMRRIDSREYRWNERASDYMRRAWFVRYAMGSRGFSVDSKRRRWIWPERRVR